MQIDVTGLHVTITDELREQVEKRFEKLARQLPDETPCKVTFHEHRNPANPDRHQIEATLRLKGATLHAEAERSEVGPAIGEVVDELQRQVAKRKDKELSTRRPGTDTIRRAEVAEAPEPA